MRMPLPRARRLAAVAALSAMAAVTLTGCGSSPAGPAAVVDSAPSTAPDGAIPLSPAFAKPDLVLTDQHGRPYNLDQETAGKPLLLYFGYTHCPDICPTTMADLAVAEQSLPEAERQELQVVFVSTDPVRDTPQRLTQWLDAFNPAFIGLTGDFATIQAAARSVGVAVSPPVKNADGSYTVTHGAEVLVFSPKDDKAHLLFPSGVSAQQYAAALPTLIKGGTL
jgi:protein SCO1/2